MKREKYAFKMQLNPGKLAEYKKRHDENWPELVALLKDAGICYYSVSLDEDTDIIFGVLWRTVPNKMDALPPHAIIKKGWAHMADLRQTHLKNEPVAKSVVTVFHMD